MNTCWKGQVYSVKLPKRKHDRFCGFSPTSQGNSLSKILLASCILSTLGYLVNHRTAFGRKYPRNLWIVTFTVQLVVMQRLPGNQNRVVDGFDLGVCYIVLINILFFLTYLFTSKLIKITIHVFISNSTFRVTRRVV